MSYREKEREVDRERERERKKERKKERVCLSDICMVNDKTLNMNDSYKNFRLFLQII